MSTILSTNADMGISVTTYTLKASIQEILLAQLRSKHTSKNMMRSVRFV